MSSLSLPTAWLASRLHCNRSTRRLLLIPCRRVGEISSTLSARACGTSLPLADMLSISSTKKSAPSRGTMSLPVSRRLSCLHPAPHALYLAHRPRDLAVRQIASDLLRLGDVDSQSPAGGSDRDRALPALPARFLNPSFLSQPHSPKFHSPPRLLARSSTPVNQLVPRL